ncbi:MAG: hypothetical protein EKK63_11120 [Acinetobacter sp.]|uniref:hypothetical protein n=1 Tax=Acinetobacter sp. TaxID=472 RepID=UPI000FAD5C7A|nr:hypothetical protein [Acinetobacter sp.]RUP38911.1 MAG: hypothetical protein EKK63_11120 [Acinetobacter sp.]
MAKLIFESKEPITLTTEDAGLTLLVNDGNPELVKESELDNGIWLRFGSWDDNGCNDPLVSHTDIKKLEGKKVRITLEVID